MINGQKRLFSRVSLLSTLVILMACQSANGNPKPLSNERLVFQEMQSDFKRENKNLRQWDAPVVADLDQDGYPDLLLNDHGFSIRVMWNNQGKYAKPYDLIMGDVHGISVADFDQDGLNEIILARGGGSGSNARNSKVFRVEKKRRFTEVADFDIPLENMRGRTVKFVDLNNNGQLDLLNFAFPDQAKKGQSENYIYKNDNNGQLQLVNQLPAIKADGQKTLVTDFNNDGLADIILYGFGAVKVYQGKGNFNYIDVTDKVFDQPLLNVTSVAEIDFDNDGDFDLFFTRGKEFEGGDAFYDAASQVWGFFAKRGEFQFDHLKMGDVFQLENFQSQWPHKSLYIGESGYEYEYLGETHSGRDIRLVNSDALGFPDKRDKKGAYIGYIGNQQWRVAANIFSPMTAIVRGVKSYPAQKVAPGLKDVLLENVNGVFKDVTTAQQILDVEHSMGSAIGDFNNDGYTDILVVPRGNLVSPIHSTLLLNQGQKRGFIKSSTHNIITPELGAIGMSAQVVDYNLDGKIDVVVGNDRGKWHLFKNQLKGSENHFVTINVGKHKQVSSLGALVTVKACGQQQIQKVGATSAAYSLSFNSIVHFGLGACQKIEQIKVTWSDQTMKLHPVTNIKLNTIIKVGN